VTYADNYYQGNQGIVANAHLNKQLRGLGNKTAFDWYLGTVNLDSVASDRLETWYAGDPIKQGWALSALGGRRNLRTFGDQELPEDVKSDNTATRRQRGDFAVQRCSMETLMQ
jgi:hypothetical protein